MLRLLVYIHRGVLKRNISLVLRTCCSGLKIDLVKRGFGLEISFNVSAIGTSRIRMESPAAASSDVSGGKIQTYGGIHSGF